MMKNVLVFGANSAVAQGLCLELHKCYHSRFFFVARNSEKLTACQQRFNQLAPDCCAGLATLDLECIHTDSMNKLNELAIEALGSIDLVLIAHGDLFSQENTEHDIALLQQSLRVNALSPMSIIIAQLNALLEQGQTNTKFAVITSVAGQRGRPRNFTYGAAKGAVSLFLQGLRSVHYQSGVEFYDFRLGPVITPMTEHHPKNFSFSTVDEVSQCMVKALQSKRFVHYVPPWWRWVMLLVRLLPEAIFQRLSFLSAR